jgi:hypothetical protein
MGGFRRFIIKTAEILMILVVIGMTVGTGISGSTGMQIAFGGQYWILGFVLGAIGGFAAAAVIAAYFFLLAEIAENTRRPM